MIGVVSVQAGSRIYQHEVKDMPQSKEDSHIVAAYGLGKCPKLVQQVMSGPDALQVRRNALKVLCEEFRNPMSISGCAKAGVFRVLPHYVLDDDLVTCEQSSRALALGAQDYNGRTAMLKEGAPATIIAALDSGPVSVRCNVYEALVNAAAMAPGVKALVAAGYPAKLVEKVASEVDELKTKALKVLCACLRDGDGLQQALKNKAVEEFIALLASKEVEVRKEAAITLGTICFNEMAKIVAIQANGVGFLAQLLDDENVNVRAASLGALMTITTVDAGKRAILDTNAVELTLHTIQQGKTVALLNALKLVASMAAHPDLRSQIKDDEASLNTVKELEECDDPMLATHATIARQAVLWTP